MRFLKKKEEPQWMTDWRIEAFRAWQEMVEPEWATNNRRNFLVIIHFGEMIL